MKRSAFAVGLVFLIFFVISLVTNILGSIIPNIIEDFGLSLFVGSLVTFSFFIAYGVMSIPAGVLLERFREDPAGIADVALAPLGSLLAAFGEAVSVDLRDPSGVGRPWGAFRLADASLGSSGGDQRPGHILAGGTLEVPGRAGRSRRSATRTAGVEGSGGG